MNFTIVVDDQRKLEGLSVACAMYNAEEAGKNPDHVSLTPTQYLEFILNCALQSYVNNLLQR